MNQSTPLYAITGLILWFVVSLVVNISGIQKLEILKVWGIENMQQLEILYKSDVYRDMQTQAILQLEDQLVQMSKMTWDIE